MALDRRSLLQLGGLGLVAAGLMPRVLLAEGKDAPAPVVLGEAKGAGQSAQFAIGEKAGTFRKHGLDVTLRIFGSGAAMGPALVAGSLNVIATGDVPGIPIMVAGAPVRALCPLSDFSSDQAIVTKKSITRPEDLLGKKIALYKGSVASLLIDRYAAYYKLDLGRIGLIHMDAVQQPPALANGDIDGYVSWEPHIWSGIRRVPDAHVLARADEPVQYIKVFDLLLIRQDYLKANAEAVKRLLTALADALREATATDRDTQVRVAEYLRQSQSLDLPVDALIDMMKRRKYTMTIDKDLIDAELVNTDFLHGLGRIKSKPSVLSWLDPEPLRSARPDLVKI